MKKLFNFTDNIYLNYNKNHSLKNAHYSNTIILKCNNKFQKLLSLLNATKNMNNISKLKPEQFLFRLQRIIGTAAIEFKCNLNHYEKYTNYCLVLTMFII